MAWLCILFADVFEIAWPFMLKSLTRLSVWWSLSVALVMNPPGAWAVAVRDAPEVAQQLWTFHSPSGPKGRFDPCNFGFWGIWNFSTNKSVAKSLLAYL